VLRPAPAVLEKNNALVSFDRTNHAVILGAPIGKLETLGYTFPSIVNRLTDLGVKFESHQQAGLPVHLVNTSYDGLGPRLGFAYKVGDGAKSFVLRGGYRISYFHFVMGGWAAPMRQNLTDDSTPLLEADTGRLFAGWAAELQHPHRARLHLRPEH
jgi:hypothetical protein